MDLRLVDTSSLDEKTQMQLAVFYDAWRPHNAIPSRKVLKVEGKGSYFSESNTIQKIKHQASMMDQMYYSFLQTVTRDEKGNIKDE